MPERECHKYLATYKHLFIPKMWQHMTTVATLELG